MKVVFLNQIPEVNNKYSFSLAKGVKNAGVDISVCGIETDDVSEYKDVSYLPFFESYSTINNPVKKILSYKKSFEKVYRYCVNNKVDILHVQWYIFSPVDWIYHKKLRKAGIKVVTTIHDLLPFNKKFYDYYYHKKIYSNSDFVISQAKKNKETLIKEYGVDNGKIVYIPHGHYMEYAEMATKEESIKYLNLPANRPIILFFGQIKKVKGVGVLISAMRDVVKKHPDVLCVIAGKVWHDDFSEYQSLIDKYELSENIRTDIRFIPDDEIKYYFNSADIVALPYLQIYQSGVVLLAYAYEKPIVATMEGEFLNVVKDKETGLLVPAGDITELGKAINWYLDNPQEAHNYAVEGKKDIEKRLNWDKIGMDIYKIYSIVVNSEF